MKEKTNGANLNQKGKQKQTMDNTEGYPEYPESEDIYGKYHKERSINPEDPARSNFRSDFIRIGKNNEKDFAEDVSGSDLDIPGSELDDELELVGSEDEENNYYSLGGDEHNDLDEESIEL